MRKWTNRNSPVARKVRDVSERNIQAYVAQPDLVEEHFRIEAQVLSGGYGHRQIFELVQNAADALAVAGVRGKIHVLLTESALYCANEGAPIDEDGARAILMSHLSAKGGRQIGHFGLGFKSVLAVSRSPEILSTSGSFRFSQEYTERRIRSLLPLAANVPLLRVGEIVESPDQVQDPVLEQLSWATTVVRLPRNAPGAAWLAGDIATFPPEFLLFSRHVASLILQDRTAGVFRKITADFEGDTAVLEEDGTRRKWRVFDRDAAVLDLPDEARRDNEPGVAGRDTLPILWAVPLDPTRSRGRYWAFFPTETEMTLAGILNAPWKTHSDRLNVMASSPFNHALLDVTLQLLVTSWPQLFDPADPGAILDLLPARLADALNPLDEYVSRRLDDLLGGIPSIPDSSGSLAIPATLRLRPDVATRGPVHDWLQQNSEAEVDSSLCHLSVEGRERRARATRLGVPSIDISTWLESIASPGDSSASIAALSLAAVIREASARSDLGPLRDIRMILTSECSLTSASAGNLYLPESHHQPEDGLLFPHADLLESPTVAAELRALGLKPLSPLEGLRRLLQARPVDWRALWTFLHNYRSPALEELLFDTFPPPHKSRALAVRTMSGDFRTIDTVLLPGPLASVDPANGHLVVDDAFHPRDDLLLMEFLGAIAGPRADADLSGDPLFVDYLRKCRKKYLLGLQPSSRRPSEAYLEFRDSVGPGPLRFLRELTEDAVLAYTKALLPLLHAATHVVLAHSTQPSAYPSVSFPSPAGYWTRLLGQLETSLGVHRVQDCVAPALGRWARLLPVAACTSSDAGALGLPETLESLTESQWTAAFAATETVTDIAFLAQFYEAASAIRPAPDRLRCLRGSTVVSEVAAAVQVSWHPGTLEAARSLPESILPVAGREAADHLSTRWGLRLLNLEVGFTPAGGQIRLLERFPELEGSGTASLTDVLLQPCDAVWFALPVDGGENRQFTDIVLRENQILYDLSVPDELLLRGLAPILGLVLDDDRIQRVLGHARRRERQERAAAVRAETDLAAKLLLCVGTEGIRRRLPAGTRLSGLGGPSSDLELARLAVGAFGTELLVRYAEELAVGGFHPPSLGRGSDSALEFCADLGFPPEFAGVPLQPRSPWIETTGPLTLPPLHPFQEVIAERVVTFLGSTPPGRGLISLPTGAGKTRVAVEAAIRAINRGLVRGSLLWLAQTDELCEQAVQAWVEAWRAIGPPDTLRVSRLWGQTSWKVVRAKASFHVVIASYQTLVNRIEENQFSWVKDVACVVVDEAHGAIAPSYTHIFKHLGLTSSRTERPLLGLTATPFRGTMNEEESRSLARRFYNRRFDHGALGEGDPYQVLQRMGVLAYVEHATLPGEDISLSPDQRKQLDQFGVLPRDVEHWLGGLQSRNDRIVNEVMGLAEAHSPILVFATSVDNAMGLAGLLEARGVPAQAITGATDRLERRAHIELFKRGALKVLTNYNVLATGFDAPSVRALVITRPVYSRVLYQQMIGRGLRGPLNGGKELCLVVNVLDNVLNYGETLAFKHFEYLWTHGTQGIV